MADDRLRREIRSVKRTSWLNVKAEAAKMPGVSGVQQLAGEVVTLYGEGNLLKKSQMQPEKICEEIKNEIDSRLNEYRCFNSDEQREQVKNNIMNGVEEKLEDKVEKATTGL